MFDNINYFDELIDCDDDDYKIANYICNFCNSKNNRLYMEPHGLYICINCAYKENKSRKST